MVTFSVALTSQHLTCGLAVSGRGLAESCSSIRLGLRPASPLGNTVSATCPVDETLFTWGTLSMSVNNILPHSKSILAPYRSMKSVPSRPPALVGSEHAKKECVNSIPFSRKVTDCCPLISRTSLVTPQGSSVVTCTLLLDMPRCIIDTLEAVSKIKLLNIFSISADIVGVPCSNRIGTVSFLTAFSGALRRKELPSFTPLLRFPDSWFSFRTPFLF